MVVGLLFTIVWWFLVVFIGLVTLPLTFRFFKDFPDKGYFLSKILGLCIICYINWLLCSLHIIPFSRISVFISIIILAYLAYLFRSESLKNILDFFKERKKIVFVSEGLFLILFLAFSVVRMCNPDIASTEKLPDFAFLNGILNSRYFPPQDPWFSGASINYFYYGHYHIAFLTKLSGIPSEYTFNLGIALLFALTFITASGVSFGLIRKLGYGVLGGVFVALIGNLDGIVQLLTQLKKVLAGTASLTPMNWFNWWMSSRVIVREGIDVTINEFPFWSYILGDLHAHVNVVPFSLLVLGMLLQFFLNTETELGNIKRNNDFIFRTIVFSVALGVIPAANTWDAPTYFSLTVLVLLMTRYIHCSSDSSRSIGGIIVGSIIMPVKNLFQREKLHSQDEKSNRKDTIGFLIRIALAVGCAIILYLPFYVYFHSSGTQGVKWVNPIQRTLAGDFLTIYGFFFYCLGSLILMRKWPGFKKTVKRLQLLIALLYIMGFFFVYLIFDRFMIALCAFLLVLLLQIRVDTRDVEDKRSMFAIFLFFVVLLILLGCEFFYIKDAYGRTLERQNTIFKFYYQAWIFCGIAAAYAVYWIREKIRSDVVNWWEPGYRLLLVCTLVFPIIGTAVKCNDFKAIRNPDTYSKPTLEGIWYMSWRYPDDYKVIKYLKKNAKPDEGVLEATGPAFSHYGRVSSATGLRTILGWANHENIWRDGTWKLVNERVQDVKRIYETKNYEEAKKLLEKYRIKYVYVGHLEREHYPAGDFGKFKSFMKEVLRVRDNKGNTSFLYMVKHEDRK